MLFPAVTVILSVETYTPRAQASAKANPDTDDFQNLMGTTVSKHTSIVKKIMKIRLVFPQI